MDKKLGMLRRATELFEKQESIINFLKAQGEQQNNSLSDILISYDIQAGTYIQHYRNYSEPRERFYDELGEVFNRLGAFDSLYEAGVGEAVSLGCLLQRMDTQPKQIYGLDLAWSRIKYGQSFLQELDIKHSQLFTGDFFHTPLQDQSVDVVYTVHAIEPNGGKEREALQELYRVARNYLVLIEPAYELADETSRARMRSLGYITNLYQTALELEYQIEEYRLCEHSLNKHNPSGIMIIKKEKDEQRRDLEASALCCPITKAPLTLMRSAYYAKQSMLAYPILEGVPCLLPQNAIVATHFEDFA